MKGIICSPFLSILQYTRMETYKLASEKGNNVRLSFKFLPVLLFSFEVLANSFTLSECD